MNSKDNNALRASIPHVMPPDKLVITSGIAALGIDAVGKILRKVKEYDRFNKDTDPWGERDMGFFKYEGKDIIWKIDYYDGHEGLNLVLTVMLAEEY